MASLDILIPTRNRPTELAVTLAGVAAQKRPDIRIVISDQSDDSPSYETPAAKTLCAQFRRTGTPVELFRHMPRRGMAEQRNFLLSKAASPYALFLDDDVWLEPGALHRLWTAMETLRCGFVGSALQGLSYLHDVRPQEWEPYEEWESRVEPELVVSDSPGFDRWMLHNAANPTHLAARLRLSPGEWRAYKVAWIGGCVLFDREKLYDCGGFEFWRELPPEHVGEDVAAQQRVMAR